MVTHQTTDDIVDTPETLEPGRGVINAVMRGGGLEGVHSGVVAQLLGQTQALRGHGEEATQVRRGEAVGGLHLGLQEGGDGLAEHFEVMEGLLH